ncbi:MAG: DUF72 domain-containing protein [Bacteriovorax sp.]
MKKAKIYIGTSGWSYQHWKGTVYPADIKDSDLLPFYVLQFKSVEINSSFYHLPSANTFRVWKNKVPKNFIFSVKASRYITHMKKLKTDNDGLKNFLKHARVLKENLGPILFQLPPHWKLNLERLDLFLTSLPKSHRYTFEFRNHTWFDERVYQLLRKHKCALCIYDLENFISPMEVTANFVYVRLHGPQNKYGGSYSRPTLKKWAKRAQNWLADGLDVYIYFDNDEAGYAALNAEKLSQLALTSQ